MIRRFVSTAALLSLAACSFEPAYRRPAPAIPAALPAAGQAETVPAKLSYRDVFRDPKLSSAFLEHLAVGGVDGTLKHRFTKLAGERAVLAKTGTLADAVALSGYVIAANRARPLAFSALVEGTKGRAGVVRNRIDQAIEVLAREPVG